MTAKPTFTDPKMRGMRRSRPHPTQEAQLQPEAPRWGSFAALRELLGDRARYGALIAQFRDVQTRHASRLKARGERVSLQEQASTLRAVIEQLQASAPIVKVHELLELADAFTEARLEAAIFRRDKADGRRPCRDDWHLLDRAELLRAARDALLDLPKGAGGRPGAAAADEIDRDAAREVIAACIAFAAESAYAIERQAADWFEIFDAVLNSTNPKPRAARQGLYRELLQQAQAGGVAGLGKVSRGRKLALR